ncbi:MAG: transposase [Burkholderiales bacterium]|nr:transposase [Burkholderiales bacterium]
MGVPQEILAVPRPTNTIVQDLGGNGLRRFAVLERKGIVHTEAGKRYPRNGKVVGHIIDGKFMPRKPNAGTGDENMLSYGVPALVHDQMRDVQSELLEVYGVRDVYTTMALVAVRVKCPGIACRTVDNVYRTSYASRYWHNAAVSKNSLSSLLERLGMDVAKRRDFFRRHVEAAAKGCHILIDGTLKQDTSTINDVSGYSYKARVRGTRDISLLYAFCVERNEPACAEVFPGNCPDVSAVRSFVEHNGIKSGIIIADKGFSPSKVLELHRQFPNLHFLIPLKRNSDYVKEYHLLDFSESDRTLGKSGALYKTAKTTDGLFLYAFKDIARAAKEYRDYMEREIKAGTFSPEKLQKKMGSFGVIAFISDIELDPEIVYSNYLDRWLIELAFDRYKNDLELDITRVQNNFSVQGNEFVNFLCTLATFRILNLMARKKLLEKMTYGQLIDELDCAQRSSKAPLEVEPSRDDGYWDNKDFGYDVLAALGLCKPDAGKKNSCKVNEGQAKRPRGRPRKEKPEFVGPKRPVGRPRIHPLQTDAVKRPRGRPRKSVVISSSDSQ